MLKCLMKYEWVKLRRDTLPAGKGIMGAWAKLAARAAFRKGHASYCGHKNAVSPGMWSGGIVGLKSILGIRSRTQALEILDKLSALGYLKYTLDSKTKKLTYQLTDWVVKCSGEECMNGTVYATDGFGFLCLPRNITQRLAGEQYTFDEADAWLDLWCHTVSEEPGNAFSFMAPAVQYGNYSAILTMEKLGQRWGWEKTKVWRFFKKHGDVFALYRLPGSYGCLVFNKSYPMDTEVSLPKQTEILRILDEIRIWGANTHKVGSDNDHINRLVAWYSRNAVEKSTDNVEENRVALLDSMQQHAETPPFEAGDAADGYNRAQFQSFMPGYEQPVTSVDGTGRMDGHFEVRHENGSGTMFYDTAQYAPPRGDYQVYEDVHGSQWYAVHGEAAVERKPVYENGKPVYDGDNVRAVSTETVRYKSTPSRYGEPKSRDDSGIKPPRRRR